MITINKNIDWLKQYSGTRADQQAVLSNTENYTFAELNQLVDNTVNYLLDSGIKKDEHCAVISGNNLDFVVYLLAIWRIGAVAVPLNKRLSEKELNSQISSTDCKYILLHDELSGRFKFSIYKTLIIPSALSHAAKASDKNGDYSDNKMSLMIFTSGSTDIPKAVFYRFKNLTYSAEQTLSLAAADENDSWLASLPFYHIGGFMIIVRAMMAGLPIIIPDSLKQEDILNSIKSFSPSIISFVPTQLSRIINEDIIPKDNLKAVFIGGGPSDNLLINSAVNKGWPLIKVYGSTETCSMITALDLRDGIKKINSGGKVIGNAIISIDKAKGEIIIEGKSVADGYYNQPDTRLSGGVFHSNDFGFVDVEGYLHVEGRIDDIIISGGENINTREILKLLFENENIEDAHVFGMDDAEWGQALSCAVVARDPAVNSNTILEYLKTKTAGYKLPKKIFFVDSIPRTDLGKVNNSQLLKKINKK